MITSRVTCWVAAPLPKMFEMSFFFEDKATKTYREYTTAYAGQDGAADGVEKCLARGVFKLAL